MIKNVALLLLCSWAMLLAQAPGSLQGNITDESGALVPGAKIAITGPDGAVKATTSGNNGAYVVNGLVPGKYSVQASAPGLAQAAPAAVEIGTGSATLNIPLKVVLENQEVTVQESTGPMVSTDPSQNAGALILKGDDLQALSDDPDDLQADLQALAGPAAGPNGGQIYIDGFTGGQIPNKDSIREVRINQNPFSPEYDKIGFGRIEILTKPGTDKFRGQAYFNYGNDFFNSRNPFAYVKPPFNLEEYGGNVSGPVGKKASFFIDIDRRAIDNSGVISAYDPTSLLPFSDVLTEPFRRIRVSPRLDYQLNSNNTLTFRYGFTRNAQDNQGVGGFNLASQAYNLVTTDNTVQATETAVLTPKVINETRFQYMHTTTTEVGLNNSPSINVLSAFNGGGGGVGNYSDVEGRYEVQNYTSIAAGQHAWKFGIRLRAVHLENTSPNNFAGTFSFAGGYIDPGNESVDCLDPSTPGCVFQTSIQRYQLALAGQALPTQFTINTGNPFARVGQMDAGLFVGDDWRVRPNLTLSLGLRYEMQTNIGDKHDFAPRIGFAYAPGGTPKGLARPKLVFRGGFGIFYDRFAETNILTAERFNGENELQYIIPNPTFYPNIPTVSQLQQYAAANGIQPVSTIHTIDPTLRTPYVIQSAIGVERQVGKGTTVAVNYTNTHGVHELLTRNINSPLPGTYTGVTGSGVFPYPGQGPIYQVESDGLYNQNQIVTNVNSRLSNKVSLFGFYMLNYAKSNTDGVNTFPANPYNLAQDYGSAATDIRHRGLIGGSITTWWDVRLNPFVTMQSGSPFNIVTGSDLYGDSILNTARPAFATDPTRPGLIETPYGLLDPNPIAGEKIIPRNYGRGPAQYLVNMRLAKTFGFGAPREGSPSRRRDGGGGMPSGPMFGGGPGGGGPGGHGGGPGPGGFGGGATTNHRYNLTVSIQARNVFNHDNVGPIIGNLTSPLFDHANSIAGGFGAFAENANNRRIEFQARFQF